jgi:mevalonate pyrophosphate decarboxylase
MDTDYQELIAAVSTEVATTFLAHEDNLVARATLLDADIAEITRQIGRESTKKVLEHVRDDLVKKNKTTTSSSKNVPSSALIASSAQ